MEYKNDLKVEKYNIIDILNSELTFLIPIYQRKYEWDEDNLFKLLDDIYARIEDNTSHFFGSLVIRKEENKNNVYWRVIDGQQRLTTSLILICVVRDILHEMTNSNLEISKIISINKNEYDFKRLDNIFKNANITGKYGENNVFQEILKQKCEDVNYKKERVAKNYCYIKKN